MATLTRHQRMVLLDVCRVLTRDRYRPRAVTAKNLRNAVAYDPSPSETKDYRTLQVWPVGAAMALEHLADKGYVASRACHPGPRSRPTSSPTWAGAGGTTVLM